MSRLSIIAIVALTSSVALHGAEPTLPRQRPPSFGIAVVRVREELLITRLDVKHVPEQRTKAVQEVVDGKRIAKAVPYVVYKPVWETAQRRNKAKDCLVFRDGVQLEEEMWTLLLTERTPVVVFDSDQPPDPFYLQFFKAGTLVVCAPPSRPLTTTAPRAPLPPPPTSWPRAKREPGAPEAPPKPPPPPRETPGGF